MEDRSEITVEALLHRLGQHDKVGADEAAALRSSLGPPEVVPRGRDLVTEGSVPRTSTLMVEGMSFRYRVLKNGRRQIVALHVPGDFVDLHSFTLKEMDHSVGTFSRTLVSRMPHEALLRITETKPHLTRLLWLLTLVDAAIVRERLVSMGRRSALERAAHLICELHVRFKAIKRDRDDGYELPLTQADLGDVLGLSIVHINRVLRELRERGLAVWEAGFMHVLDPAALAALADFDDVYLHRVRRSR